MRDKIAGSSVGTMATYPTVPDRPRSYALEQSEDRLAPGNSLRRSRSSKRGSATDCGCRRQPADDGSAPPGTVAAAYAAARRGAFEACGADEIGKGATMKFAKTLRSVTRVERSFMSSE